MKSRAMLFLRSFKYFMGVVAIGFGFLFFTAPSLFGVVFISGAAIGSVIIWALIGQLLGFIGETAYEERKALKPHHHHRRADDEECEEEVVHEHRTEKTETHAHAH